DGIEIRPLPTLLGESDFSEMFLEEVRVPVENLVGEENDGWRITNVTLAFERGSAWAADISTLTEWGGRSSSRASVSVGAGPAASLWKRSRLTIADRVCA
ncbi:MAG: hypothetical protein AAFW98_01600, partial [Pseudomonadota bacterium]